MRTSFDGDLEPCATVQNQLMNYCKQWIEMEWNKNWMGLGKDEWVTSLDELVQLKLKKNEAC
jgi:hypothetical protein